MRLGVTGHQRRDGADWEWVAAEVRLLIGSLVGPVEAWSSLAIGADQLVARAVLDSGGTIVTVVPGDWYEECFSSDGLASYRDLVGRGRTIVLSAMTGEDAFLAAGLNVADNCDLLLAIWDGEAARGKGGTADVVAHAIKAGREVLRIDPITKRRQDLTSRTR